MLRDKPGLPHPAENLTKLLSLSNFTSGVTAAQKGYNSKPGVSEPVLSTSMSIMIPITGETIPHRGARDYQRQGQGGDDSLSWLVMLTLQQGKWRCRRFTDLVARGHDY